MVWHGRNCHLIHYGLGGPCVHSSYRYVSCPFASGFHDSNGSTLFPGAHIHIAHLAITGWWLIASKDVSCVCLHRGLYYCNGLRSRGS